MKRYALTGMGVAPEDDDGNAASVKAVNGVISEDQVATIFDMIKRSKTDTGKFCSYIGVASVPDILAKDYEKAITALNMKDRKAAQ